MSAPVKKVPIHLQSSQNRLLIKSGRIVNDDGISENDVFIEDGIIKEIGKNLIIPGGTRTIDARGLFLLPGGIDPHTHLDFEFMGTVSADDFYQGTKAAIAGGTTMIIDFVIPKKGESLIDAYHSYRQKADDKVCCDYGLHSAITSWDHKVKNEMEILCSKYGINSFKMFMAYSFRLDDSELYSAFEYIRKLGAIALVHAENGAIIEKNTERLLEKGITGPEGHELSRPEEIEAEAVNRACVIAKQVACPLYIVHVMSKSAAQALVIARDRGSQVYGETLVAALATDGSHYKHKCFHHAAGYVLSPPLRPDPTTPQFLMNYLKQ
ncbi:dihydropyrimidinase-like [Agrilus planipennis]|uniref:dihydropyrimidinase n=1 Tax=Agrilus planipennis TaxID=224129 RepID=A0A7F5RNL7_AGRPL|nr:dihydropyrimidinase-like [Agrilus planipennis]